MSDTAGSGRVPVIWNSKAGAKLGATGGPVDGDQLRELLARYGVETDIVATGSAEEARDAVRAAVAEKRRMVVAAGGDGTIAEIASELLSTDVALAILPLGTVMNVVRMLSLPRDVEEAAALIGAGRTRLIDVGAANGVIFYEAASVGLNAQMFKVAQQWEEGDVVSPLRVLWVALRYRPARMTIELDDETITTRALMVTISNGAYTGVGMTVAPDARLDDGRFDVRVFRRFSRFDLLRHLASIAFGRRAYSPKISTYRSARVLVTSRRRLPCRADSHDLGTTPLECRAHRRILRVVVGPEPASG